MNIPLGGTAAPPAPASLTARQADALHLLCELRRRGYTLALAGEGLTVIPGSRLNDGERAEIKEWKAELLVLLFEGR